MLEILAFTVVLTAAYLAVAFAVLARAHRYAVARRVEAIIPRPDRPARAIGGKGWALRALEGSRSLFAFQMRRSWGVSAGPGLLLGAAALGACAAWLVVVFGFRYSHYTGALAALGGFFLVPRLLLIRQQRRMDRAFAGLLPDAIDMIVRVVRAGLPVTAAIRIVARETDPPLCAVFARVADQTEIGMPIDEALVATSEASGNADFRFLAVAIALQQSTGGNLATTLDTLSEIIRKRRAVRLKARATTAEVKISAIVLGSMPFLVMGALLLVAPNYLDPLFDDPRGNLILSLAAAGLVLAGFTMRSMMRAALRV